MKVDGVDTDVLLDTLLSKWGLLSAFNEKVREELPNILDKYPKAFGYIEDLLLKPFWSYAFDLYGYEAESGFFHDIRCIQNVLMCDKNKGSGLLLLVFLHGGG